ncbi:hypothetical protein ScPMuIL_004294 [Solemya velum]
MLCGGGILFLACSLLPFLRLSFSSRPSYRIPNSIFPDNLISGSGEMALKPVLPELSDDEDVTSVESGSGNSLIILDNPPHTQNTQIQTNNIPRYSESCCSVGLMVGNNGLHCKPKYYRRKIQMQNRNMIRHVYWNNIRATESTVQNRNRIRRELWSKNTNVRSRSRSRSNRKRIHGQQTNDSLLAGDKAYLTQISLGTLHTALPHLVPLKTSSRLKNWILRNTDYGGEHNILLQNRILRSADYEGKYNIFLLQNRILGSADHQGEYNIFSLQNWTLRSADYKGDYNVFSPQNRIPRSTNNEDEHRHLTS